MFLGVDPGASGATCFLEVSTLPVFARHDSTPSDYVADCASRLADASMEAGGLRAFSFAVVERVGAFPGQGVSSCFKFGRSAGFLEGVLTTLRVPFEFASPHVWQKAMGITAINGESKTAHKNRTKAKAQQLFPQLKITHATADALLLAEYARRLWNQRNGATT